MATTSTRPDPARRLRIAFLLSYLAGAAFVAAAVLVPWDLYLTVGLPNAVMLIYLLGFFVSRRPAHLVEPFADSFYQLGFLLTVTALLASFLPYALQAADLSAETVLARFAVALTTTLFGLIGRVCLRPFAMTADQAETQAHGSLSDRTREFGDQLDTATEQFRDTIGRLNADLEHTVAASVDGIEAAGKAGIAELRETADAARQTIAQSTSATVDQLENQIHHTFRRSRESIDAFGESMAALQERTAGTVEPFSEEMRGLVAELANVREAAARNEERITRIFATYEQMIAKLREAQEAGDRSQERLNSRMSDLMLALESASRTVDSLSGGTTAVIGRLGEEIVGVRDARGALAADAEAIAEIGAKLSAELNVAVEQAAAQKRSDPESPPLTIDEDAFGEIPRPGGEDELYIPRLRGRPGRSRGSE